MKVSSRKNRFFILSVLLVILCCIFFHRVYNKLPVGWHDWAQSDRLAIALEYHDTGMQLFLPRTKYLGSIDRVVGCELPLIQYVVASLGFVFGRQSIPFIFRFFTLLFSLSYLYLILEYVYLKTQHILIALFAVILSITPPVLAFYSITFLADTPVLSLIMSSYCLWLFFQECQKPHLLYWAVILVLLGANLRFMAVFHAGLLILLCIWEAYKMPKSSRNKVLITLFSIAFAGVSLIVSQYFYIQYLNKTYQCGIFLSSLMSITELKVPVIQYFTNVFNFWQLDYFTRGHYYVIPAFLLFICISAFQHKAFPIQNALKMLIGFLFIALLWLILMAQQYFIHDYYTIISIYPFLLSIILWGSIAFSYQLNTQYKKYIFIFSIIGLTIWSVIFTHIKLVQRESNDSLETRWIVRHQISLSSLGIPTDANALFIGTPAPNIAPIYFDRNGLRHDNHLENGDSPEMFRDFMKDRNISWAVMSNFTYQNIQKFHPDFFQQVELKQGDTYWAFRFK